MGEIYIPPDQMIALSNVDVSELDKLVEQSMREERSDLLGRLPLANCGPYIATKLQNFWQALARHRQAKASRKRAETESYLRRTGRELSFAVQQMKRRMDTEQQERQLFQINDNILRPLHFDKHLTVTIKYRWRRAVDNEWKFGNITFMHDANTRPDYLRPAPKRKPSVAKQEQELQYSLFQDWERLTSDALYSVRDYFRGGGDGESIPATFRATVDPYTGVLNNYSTQFWRQRS
jgi:hypothetical protein